MKNTLTTIQQELYDNLAGELSELILSTDDIITVLRTMAVDVSKDTGFKPCIVCGETDPLLFYMSNKVYCKKCAKEKLYTWRRNSKSGTKDVALSNPCKLEDAVLRVLAKSAVTDIQKTQLLYDLYDKFNEFLED